MKEFIIFQTYIRTSSKEGVTTIQLGINKKNLLVKLQDVYNKHVI